MRIPDPTPCTSRASQDHVLSKEEIFKRSSPTSLGNLCLFQALLNRLSWSFAFRISVSFHILDFYFNFQIWKDIWTFDRLLSLSSGEQLPPVLLERCLFIFFNEKQTDKSFPDMHSALGFLSVTLNLRCVFCCQAPSEEGMAPIVQVQYHLLCIKEKGEEYLGLKLEMSEKFQGFFLCSTTQLGIV